MLWVGLTGGTGAGKSTVARFLAAQGAWIVDADALARQVLAPGQAAVEDVVSEFGDKVRAADGGVDRAALARVVFGDTDARRRLEAITHPRIGELTLARIGEAPEDAVVVHDIPLLVELDRAGDYHLVVVVHAPPDERVRRLTAERGMAEADVRARIAAQANDDQRRAAADVWIDNAGPSAGLEDVVEVLWRTRLVPFEANLRNRTPASAGPVLDERVVTHPDGAAQARVLARVRRALGGVASSLSATTVGSHMHLNLAISGADAARKAFDGLPDAGLVPVLEASDNDGARVGLARSADPGLAVECEIVAAAGPGPGERGAAP